MSAAEPAFATLTLAPPALANLERLGWRHMTPVQAASLPPALAGQDLIVQAATGSGKTAAFALTLLDRLNPRRFAVQALVLCPTRELADQVTHEIRRVARAEENVKVVTLCGGVPLRGQLASLQHGAHVAVGTPGRVLDHLDRGSLRLDALAVLVLDEADRMLDMGFHDDIARVVAHSPAARQTLLFSATYPDGIASIASRFMKSPQRIVVAAPAVAAPRREHWYEVREDERLHAVGQLLAHFRPQSALAFCNTRQQCRDLVQVLRAQGVSALALFGELDQRERDQVLVQFANRSCCVLVATDVAARGLDIAELDTVINVDVAVEPELHVHRIGRTGRLGQAAGKDGLVLNLASLDEMGRVGRIEQAQGRATEWQPLAAVATPSATAGGASPGPVQPPMATLQIAGGRKEKIRAGDVLGALTGSAGFTREQVGRIDVNDFSTYVAVERGIAREAARRLAAGRVKGRAVKVRLLDDVA